MPTDNRSQVRRRSLKPVSLTGLSERTLLDVRLCDLPVTLADGPIQRGIDQLYQELQARDIRFKPHFWLADDWFSPDGVPGVAVPFYLANSRLKRMQRKYVGALDGETFGEIMRLFRHETGHVLDHAYHLHRRKRWQQLFGKSSTVYPKHYQPDPHDGRYVVHLDGWYAQSHPDEDFAETFAVWLTPRVNWRERYRDWPALEKLTYVDELMSEIGVARPCVTTRIKPYSLRLDGRTLRECYTDRRAEGVYHGPRWYDTDLQQLFGDEGVLAATMIKGHRGRLLSRIKCDGPGYRYNVEQVLIELIMRCRVLNLRSDQPWAKLEARLGEVLVKHTSTRRSKHRRIIPM